MRVSAGAGRAAPPLLLLLLLAARLSALGPANTTTNMTSTKLSTPGPRILSNITTQSNSTNSAHGTNVTVATTLASTKAVNTTKTPITNITTRTTISSTTAKPLTTIQSTANVTMTTSKTMSPSTSITATPKSAAALAKTSSFDVGSFVGGIVLTLGMLALLYIGCKTYHSRRGVQYRTIDEHDAII